MLSIYYFRHGETDWNVVRRLQGRTDVPMNENGRAQAHSLGKALEQLPLHTIICSPLSRAQETARIVAEYQSVTIRFDPRLREIDYGDAEGLLQNEIAERLPESTIQEWGGMLPNSRYPNGESAIEAAERFRDALESAIFNDGLETFAICAHGGVFRRFLQFCVEHHPRPPALEVPNCVLFSLLFDRDARKWYLKNDVKSRTE